MLRKFIPPSVKKSIVWIYVNIYTTIIEYSELLLGYRDTLTPPRSKVFVGPGDFKRVGEEFKQHFIAIGALKPDDTVLDVGCGIGRMAVPLTNYLNPSAQYEGIDIVSMGVVWCQKNITPRFPNFRFQLADVYNSHYNLKGNFQAHEYQFPFDDNHFDFAFLTSVFTHMPVRETDHYLSEISRVLKPGGRCFATFFLLNDESRRLMAGEKSTFNFQYELDGRYTNAPKDPDAGTAFDEPLVMAMLEKHGLYTQDSIYPGHWCGRENSVTFQDIVVAYKR